MVEIIYKQLTDQKRSKNAKLIETDSVDGVYFFLKKKIG